MGGNYPKSAINKSNSSGTGGSEFRGGAGEDPKSSSVLYEEDVLKGLEMMGSYQSE